MSRADVLRLDCRSDSRFGLPCRWNRKRGYRELTKSTSLFGTMAAFIARIPQKHLVIIGGFLGTLAYVLDRRHRRIVRRNLQFTYPRWSRDRIREVARKVFRNMGTTALEICQMTCLSREDILYRVRIKGKHNLLKAKEGPKGAILFSAHIGNWEMAHVFAACYLGIHPVMVARKVRPAILDQWLFGLRTRFGGLILDKRGALAKLARVLNRGSLVGILIDQGTLRSEGVEVEFFGKATTATPAAAILARRFDVPVLPAFCVREADSCLTFIVGAPLSLKKTEDMRFDIRTNTQMMNDAVEKMVRAYPDQWFWFHKRWKRHYPHLYSEDLARARRRKERTKARAGRM